MYTYFEVGRVIATHFEEMGRDYDANRCRVIGSSVRL